MRDDTTDAAELQMDALLGIRTTGRDESHATQANNPYEPTPYAVLERLANSGLVGKRNTLVDYGCGKGRVGFYLAYQARCRVVGVEVDPWLHKCARRNLQTTRAPRTRVSFARADAATWDPSAEADRFYFFNPFSAGVFAQALDRIRASLDARPANAPEALLLCYYPDDAYIDLLDRTPWLAAREPLDCRALFGDGADPRERVTVYGTVG